MPALEKYTTAEASAFSRASPATARNSSGVLTDLTSGTIRRDYTAAGVWRGFLIEEGVESWWQNPWMTGAIAGTPGTRPTGFFSWPSTANISNNVVGSGTLATGEPYVDIQLIWIAHTTTAYFAYFDDNSFHIPSSTADPTWCARIGLQVVGGAFSGLSNFGFTFVQQTGSNVSLGTSTYGVAPTSTLTWYDFKHTFTDATHARMSTGIRFQNTTGVAGDMTLRIVFGSLVNSDRPALLPIRPTTAIPGPVTLAADDLRWRDVASWLPEDNYSLTVEVELGGVAPTGRNQGLMRLDDGTNNNYVICYQKAGTAQIWWKAVRAGVTLFDINAGTGDVSGGKTRSVLAAGTNGQTGQSSVSAATNGGATVTANIDDPIPGVSIITRALAGRSSVNAGTRVDGAEMLNGWFRYGACAASRWTDDVASYASNPAVTIRTLLTEGKVPLVLL